MNRRIITIAFTLLIGTALVGLAQNNATTYSSLVVGGEVGLGHPNNILLHGEAKESLPGLCRINVRFNPDTRDIIGGDWLRTVLQYEADGSQSEVGTLHGNITGGTVTINEDGRVTAINAAVLTVSGGNNHYSAVTGGSGLLEGSLQFEGGQPTREHGPGPSEHGSQVPVAAPESTPAIAGSRPTFNGKMTLIF